MRNSITKCLLVWMFHSKKIKKHNKASSGGMLTHCLQ